MKRSAGLYSSLTAILNTHSNADHIGGNKYLQGQTGCKVYSICSASGALPGEWLARQGDGISKEGELHGSPLERKIILIFHKV